MDFGDIFLKIEQMAGRRFDSKAPIHIDSIVPGSDDEAGLAKEYLIAMQLLGYIDFTDNTKKTFTITGIDCSGHSQP